MSESAPTLLDRLYRWFKNQWFFVALLFLAGLFLGTVELVEGYDKIRRILGWGKEAAPPEFFDCRVRLTAGNGTTDADIWTVLENLSMHSGNGKSLQGEIIPDSNTVVFRNIPVEELGNNKVKFSMSARGWKLAYPEQQFNLDREVLLTVESVSSESPPPSNRTKRETIVVRIPGMVVDADSGTPIAGIVVSFTEGEAVESNSQGQFTLEVERARLSQSLFLSFTDPSGRYRPINDNYTLTDPPDPIHMTLSKIEKR